MNRLSLLLPALLAFMFQACAPSISTTLKVKPASPAYNGPFAILEKGTLLPAGTKVLGSGKIGDTGLTASAECSYTNIMRLAEAETRKVGGNGLLIKGLATPGLISTCHRVWFDMVLLPESGLAEHLPAFFESDSVLPFAIVNVYRPPGPGFIIEYDLKLNEKKLTRVTASTVKTLIVEDFGTFKLNAATEAKSEIDIEIRPGRIYYIKAGIGLGFLVGQPSLDLLPVSEGKAEFKKMALKWGYKNVLITKSKTIITGTIYKTDATKYYYSKTVDGGGSISGSVPIADILYVLKL